MTFEKIGLGENVGYILESYNVQDINHCYSIFSVNGILCYGLRDALAKHAYFHGNADIYPASDIWTWDNATQSDRKVFSYEDNEVLLAS